MRVSGFNFAGLTSTPKLKRLKQRIRELSPLVTTAQSEEFEGLIEGLIKELQHTMYERSAETRRVLLLSQQLQRS